MKTIDELKKDLSILQAKSRSYNNVVNEGGSGYNEYDNKVDELSSLIVNLKKEQKNQIWTKEYTIQKRKIWNDAVNELRGQAINGSQVKNIEEKVGFKATDLKLAIAKHSL